ncbi:hypothetical protein LTR10_018948 [Elasticomyces elasticus]|uniref:Uncharacterized protein n=1 Tax=Exophiala sideris TaxID=1016849 RepID=A0A0D1X261_9EURO|nr:hypothetical protein LTR10_018948 [Elasticomyces elasticus]KAK5022298.1 hypothetical protein LTS07_010174 [Exophiala sideris]KAK5177650.1 hypothetical protein LTR44_009840 [Eurotiomycetes sp. CCFEE 6388]KAK5027110.1 hypothetical protein LTR13_009720 [Exophiala sideris]KAK5051685.1 hypothetical protein LTR69_010185 [Exophiala sideris]
MVIGLLLVTAIPAVTGISQAMHAQRTREERLKDEKRMKRFNIDVFCEDEDSLAKGVDGKRLVLKDDRVWIGPEKAVKPCPHGYVAECFYIEYPDNERNPAPLGLVSQVQDDPPLLNWIYVDKNTMELKYGNKSASIEHHVGPWDWTADEVGITFEKKRKRFIAVENPKTYKWQVYYDMNNDGLIGFVPQQRHGVQVYLKRTLLPEPDA